MEQRNDPRTHTKTARNGLSYFVLLRVFSWIVFVFQVEGEDRAND
jgi:hypothetical protein